MIKSDTFFWITREDTIVVYLFNHAVGEDTETIDDMEEMEDILLGATDKMQDDYESLSKEEKERVLDRTQDLLLTYYGGKIYD